MLKSPRHIHSPRLRFLYRIALFLGGAVLVDGIALVAGAVGFHYLEGLGWMDACLNASLVVTGNGPVDRPVTFGGKLFVTLYAILGVILFAAVIGAFLTPVFQRALYGLHRPRGNSHKGEVDQAAGADS